MSVVQIRLNQHQNLINFAQIPVVEFNFIESISQNDAEQWKCNESRHTKLFITISSNLLLHVPTMEFKLIISRISMSIIAENAKYDGIRIYAV